MSKIDEEEAAATVALLKGMGADYERELEELRESVIE
jgi:hydrogenase expression/formation protein HypC